VKNEIWRKVQIWIQRLMTAVAVLLLVTCFVTGAPIETEGPSQQSFLWILSLMVCVGAVGLCISGAGRPLGWVLVGSFIGAAICLCEIIGFSDIVFAPKLFFSLYLPEFLMSAGYGICRRLHVFA
jgi:cyanate permease